MRIGQQQARSWFEQARVARMATVRPDRQPHLVPVTFAMRDETIVTAVDHKPKSTRTLQRLRNIAEHPGVTLLADDYDDDWSLLWWARADGDAEITGAGDAPEFVAALTEKYAQYRQRPPSNMLIVVRVRHWTGWAGSA